VAAAAGMTESNYIRLIIQQSLAVSPETRMLMEFACIGEEKMRLLLIAAAKGELGNKEVLEQMETKAIEAGLGKVDRRLRLVRQLVQSKEQIKMKFPSHAGLILSVVLSVLAAFGCFKGYERFENPVRSFYLKTYLKTSTSPALLAKHPEPKDNSGYCGAQQR
jgi:hypothetical protein